MTTLRDEFEALMPEPVGYVPFPGEFYPPDELDAEVKDDPFTTRVYSHAQMRAMFDAATERAAKLVEALRDSHCKSTQQSPNEENWCEPDDVTCELVVAWNDAIAAIRARDEGVSNV